MTPQDVLDFWFGASGSPEHGKSRDVWFKKSDAFDEEVRARSTGKLASTSPDNSFAT